MYVKVKDTVYENAVLTATEGKGRLVLTTEESLGDLEQIFSPEEVLFIEQYSDEDELLEKWYINDLQEISYTKQDDHWLLIVKFEVSEMNKGVTEKINSLIDENDLAAIELAENVANLEFNLRALFEHVQGMTNEIRRLDTASADHDARISALEGANNNG